MTQIAEKKYTVKRLEVPDDLVQTSSVIDLNSFSDLLRQELNRRVADKGADLQFISPTALNEIVNACANIVGQLNEIQLAATYIIDPVSRLRLPPPEPDVLYKNRKSVPELRSVTPEEFIEKTAWSQYKSARLLASDFIRNLDGSLYTALNNRAHYMGFSVTELMKKIGILTRFDLYNPTPLNEREVRIIRAAQALGALAKKMDAGGQETKLQQSIDRR